MEFMVLIDETAFFCILLIEIREGTKTSPFSKKDKFCKSPTSEIEYLTKYNITGNDFSVLRFFSFEYFREESNQVQSQVGEKGGKTI